MRRKAMPKGNSGNGKVETRGRPSATSEVLRRYQIGVRLSPDERDWAEAEARKHWLPLSTWMRLKILGQL